MEPDTGDGPSREWTARHFSLTNPEGRDQGDVPALLRRVAETIEQLGPVEVMDIVFHTEMTADEPWPSTTVYYYYYDE